MLEGVEADDGLAGGSAGAGGMRGVGAVGGEDILGDDVGPLFAVAGLLFVFLLEFFQWLCESVLFGLRQEKPGKGGCMS